MIVDGATLGTARRYLAEARTSMLGRLKNACHVHVHVHVHVVSTCDHRAIYVRVLCGQGKRRTARFAVYVACVTSITQSKPRRISRPDQPIHSYCRATGDCVRL